MNELGVASWRTKFGSKENDEGVERGTNQNLQFESQYWSGETAQLTVIMMERDKGKRGLEKEKRFRDSKVDIGGKPRSR